MEQAFRNYFDDKTGKVGKPRPKTRKNSRFSYTTNNQKNSVRLVDKGVRLPKAGVVKAVIHRQPKDGWKLKSATVSMEHDGTFYVSVLFEYNENIVKIDGNKAIGLDYKSDGLYMDSDGHSPEMEKYYRKSQKRLRKLQKKLSRKIETHIVSYDSKRRPRYDRPLHECKNVEKTRKKVAKLLRHVANQRLDFLHKQSTAIAKQYDIVCVEDLNMAALANKGFGNGKATLDNGYGMFLTFLGYKLHDRGKTLVNVDKWFPSSQLCSECGYRNPKLKNPQIRKWICPVCGEHHDRDVNAAKNILYEGLRILGKST